MATQIAYGGDKWHPDFWLDEIFRWTSMCCNFNNLRATDYTGEENLTWFMKKVIVKRLNMRGITDLEKHVIASIPRKKVSVKQGDEDFMSGHLCCVILTMERSHTIQRIMIIVL